MTKFDRTKILDNKIEANKAQYMLHRKNAEISAKSSGNLDKYKYLTGEDLGYKPDALTQAKFEYSPLGKVFTTGLDKSDRKQGLLKTLKNIENKSGNQLIALNNLFDPAIKGKNNGNNKGDDDDDDDDEDDDDNDYDKRYKEIESRKKEYKDESNLDQSVDEEFNEKVRYSKNLEGKTYVTGKNKSIYANKFNNDYEKIDNAYINRKIKYIDIVNKLNKVNKGIKIYEKNHEYYNKPNIKDQINNSKKVAKGLEKIIAGIDNNKIPIGRDPIAEPGSIDLSWMHDPELYEQISQDVFARYNKDKDSNELLSIQSFLDNMNNEYTKNRKDAWKEFKTIKNNVKSKNLKDIVKELELTIFRYDYDYDMMMMMKS